jgi:hypothetical protein
MSNTTMTVPLVASKYFKQETVTLQPGQKLEVGGFKMYYVMYTLIDPPTGLGFLQISIDNGPFFPISLLPYRDEGGFQYITLYNTSQTYTVTVSLIIAVSREALLMGTWTPSYMQINAELITNVQISNTTAYYAGPFYLGIRSVVYISITNASLITSSTTNAAAITVYLYNSDQLGNLYNRLLLGSLVQYPSGYSGYANQNSMYVTIDGALLSNYVMLYFAPNAYTASYTFNLQIVAR